MKGTTLEGELNLRSIVEAKNGDLRKAVIAPPIRFTRDKTPKVRSFPRKRLSLIIPREGGPAVTLLDYMLDGLAQQPMKSPFERTPNTEETRVSTRRFLPTAGQETDLYVASKEKKRTPEPAR